MRIRFLAPVFFIVMSYAASAQRIWCHSMPAANNDQAKYVEFLSKIREHQLHLSLQPRAPLYFQVVVHIVTGPSSKVISRGQIIHQIDVLNADFAGIGSNFFKLQKEFASLLSNTEIQFCLATTDPDGEPTDGITYTSTDIADIALQSEQGHRRIHYDQLGGKTGWDPARYINIWVGEYGSFLGSANFPGMAPFPEEIGVVVDPASFGSLGDAALHTFYTDGHTLTHEMGHFFGLLHIWGTEEHGCNDSDEVDDTPNQDGPYFGCPSGDQISCGAHNMYQDFMDLTDDRCLAAFTKGQSMRMHAAIDAFYPDLIHMESCHEQIQSFDSWYKEIVWVDDQNSGQYVLYHSGTNAVKIFLDVFSVDGRLIQEDTWEGTQSYLLNLNAVASGIYFIRISDGQNDRVRKVVTFQ